VKDWTQRVLPLALKEATNALCATDWTTQDLDPSHAVDWSVESVDTSSWACVSTTANAGNDKHKRKAQEHTEPDAVQPQESLCGALVNPSTRIKK
jgi:hypothetical protein